MRDALPLPLPPEILADWTGCQSILDRVGMSRWAAFSDAELVTLSESIDYAHRYDPTPVIGDEIREALAQRGTRTP